MEEKIFIAVKAFIMDGDEVLILRESANYKTGTQIGRYDLPGGRIKWEETMFDALKREVKEETNLDIEIGNAFCTNESFPEFKDERWHIVRIFFKCCLKCKRSDLKLGNDHDNARWIKPEDYNKYKIIDNLEPCFKKAMNSRV